MVINARISVVEGELHIEIRVSQNEIALAAPVSN